MEREQTTTWRAGPPEPPDLDDDGQAGVQTVCVVNLGHVGDSDTFGVYGPGGRLLATETDPSRAETRRVMAEALRVVAEARRVLASERAG